MMKLISLAVAAAWCAGLGLVGGAGAATAQELRYRRVTFDSALPVGWHFFEPRAITNDRRVYGVLYACESASCSFAVGVYKGGSIAVLHAGIPNTANDRGTVGGEVVFDPRLDTRRAALFDGGRVRLLPRPPGEYSSSVRLLTNSGISFVASSAARSGPVTYYLRRRGRTTRLPFGPDVGPDFDVNDQATVAGTLFRSDGQRAFRHHARSGRTTVLGPLPKDAGSAGRAINGRGDVLGFSYPSASCRVERVGVWRGTTFHTYFVEGTAALPTHASDLLWNKRGLIVVTRAAPCASHDGSDMNSYLIPRPGVRLRLGDLVDRRLPPWTAIADINDRGDLVGIGSDRFFGLSDAFLLERVVGRDDRVAAAAGSAAAPARRHAPRSAALERALQARVDEIAREAMRFTTSER